MHRTREIERVLAKLVDEPHFSTNKICGPDYILE